MKEENLKNQSLIVSMPRSGLHYLVRQLENIHPSKNIFCEGYNCLDAFDKPIRHCNKPANGKPAEYCYSGRSLIKSHDFDLKLNINEYSRILILQRRDLMASLQSWFEASIKYNWEDLDNTTESFVSFSLNKVGYLKLFQEKYSHINRSNVKHFYYEDLFSNENLEESIIDIYRFFFDENPHSANPENLIERLIKPREVNSSTLFSEELSKFLDDLSSENISAKRLLLSEKIIFQHDELTKQHDELTKQHDELTKQHDELTKQHDELTKQHDELTKQHDELAQNLRNIQNSLSWKVTQPLRTSRKLLRDSKFRIVHPNYKNMP